MLASATQGGHIRGYREGVVCGRLLTWRFQ